MRLGVPQNQRNGITSGMTLNVKVNSAGEKGEARYSVPLRSVFKSGSESCVWVLGTDSTLSRRPVTVSGTMGGNAIVSDGLDGTETVIRAGVNSLHEGEKVHVLTTESDTNIGNLL